MKLQFSLLLLVSLELVAASIDYPWMYYLHYGNNVTLKPLFQNESEKILIKTCKWILPNSVELIPDVYIADTKRYSIVKYKCELTITNIQKDTNGIYHCNINDKYISKAMLNVHGAPKASLLEEFTPNLIAGFSAFGGIIAFFAFVCGIAKFRYKEPVKFFKKTQDPNKFATQDNAGFEDIDGTELEIVKETKF